MIGAIILQIILIALNAIFASAEIAVLSSNAARTEHLAAEGDKRAKKILSLTANPSRFLSTIQVAITLAGLLGSAYAAENFAQPLVDLLILLKIPLSAELLKNVCVLLITVILSFFSIVFGELVPKRVAMQNPDKAALALSGLLWFVSIAFAPFVWILTKTTNGVLRLVRIDPNEKNDEVTEEEIRMMLESGSEKGTIDKTETEMIHSIFEFDDTDLTEICTHRREVVVLYEEDGEEQWKQILSQTDFSFYPVCGETIDDVQGVLNVETYFRAGTQNFSSAIEKPLFVPEHMKADVLFATMKETGSRFAIVVDEYGGMQGVITLHDLIDVLLGDLRGETPEKIRAVGENQWIIDGSVFPKDVEEHLGISLNAGDNDTFAGFVLELLGTIPEDGTTPETETETLLLQVTKAANRRIEEVRVTKKETESEEL